MAKKKKSEYKWQISVKKAGKVLLSFGLPAAGGFLLNLSPELTTQVSLAIGTFITGIHNWLKNR